MSGNNSEKEEQQKKTLTVSIHGKEYSISSSNSEEYVQSVADYVDTKMKEVTASSNQFPSPVTVAVLAALNITDELFQERENCSEKVNIEDTIDKLTEELRESLSEIEDDHSALNNSSN